MVQLFDVQERNGRFFFLIFPIFAIPKEKKNLTKVL